MRKLLPAIGVIAGVAGVVLLAIGIAQAVGVGLLIAGLLCVGTTIGGSAGAASDL